MFRHVVMFRWMPDATEESKAAAAAGLSELPGKIDTLRDYHFGPDGGLAEGNWDFVVVADFDGEVGYLTYRDHDTHLALIAESLRPIIADRAAVQYVVDT